MFHHFKPELIWIEALQLESLFYACAIHRPVMSKKNDSKEEFRKELRDALGNVRREARKVSKDVATATKTWVKTTSKAVQNVTPKVSAAIDETMEQTSVAFRKTMTSLGKETKQVQVSFLRSYKTVLEKQMGFIEKKLQKLAK